LIDREELKIDEECLDLLALRQPMAADLRFITMAMKVSTDLERMADLSVDISQRVLELADFPLLKPLIDIPKLTLIAQEMTRNSINSFVNKDAALARQVIASDRKAGVLGDLVQQELLNKYIAKNRSDIPRAIPLLLAARQKK
jgi:phosphate transport system protein